MKITEESMKQQASGATQTSGAAQASGATQTSPPAQDTAPVPARTKSEKEKLKSMSGRDRAWYIWAYYKFHILAVVIAVVLACSIGSAIYRSTFKTALYCIYLNSRGETEVDPAPLEQDFAAYLGLDEKNLITTEISYISFDDNATEYSYASMAKITALVASKELDVIIGDQESTGHYASLNALLNLQTGLSPDVLALAEGHLYYAQDEAGTEYPCAIDLSGTDFAAASNLLQDTPLLGIMANSEHISAAESLIRYIFEP